MSSSAPPQSFDPLVDRLRELELRLTLLGGKETFQPRELGESLADCERARGKMYAEAVRHASVFALALTKALDAKVSVRLETVADRAVARLNPHFGGLVTAPVEQRLDEQEKCVVGMMQRFADLRHSAAALEDRLARAGDDLDAIWNKQDPNGLGGWRLVMRAVSAQLEFEKGQQPLADSYRVPVTPQTSASPPRAAGNLVCSRCKNISLRRIARESLLEEALRIIFVAPYRCTKCSIRSYHFRYTVKKAG